ncbi:MAG: Gmad2 immunoglobulin-like domain-containing protein [Patescibacteria group bacterium]
MHTRAALLILIALLGIVGLVLGSGILPKPAPAVIEQPPEPVVLSFRDCASAGYPVMESYPRKCRTPDGRTYVEELPAPDPTYLNASADLIVIETPTPGSVTGKSFTVTGTARGGWYFEASFPIEVRDSEGDVIATGIGQPVDGASWMTPEFVPFTAPIEIPESFIGEAVLVVMNDNPSGLPENARSVSFPFTIEY